MSDSIKKLAIAKDGQPHAIPSIKPPQNTQTITTVMSNAQDDFNSRYELVREIGKGGFSTVYQCRKRSDGQDYAVKVIDLRPLRLRERFNPARLKREVDIMRRLDHPSIIRFVEVYEDADHLMMVMEYCPGQELFDVILARRHLSEDEARPIFAQVSRALYYLHTLHIIHRDVKPENVLISNKPDANGQVVAKLLDFGLSKNANGGSAAKTFVGTPCYLAPEVEYTSKGLGGTYGLPADCWSLGAVLYVMLVARFPEFEQDQNGKVVVKLPPVLWSEISGEAKDLIRGLMNTNPKARLTMANVLLHPWLKNYRATETELAAIALHTEPLSNSLQAEEVLLAKHAHQGAMNNSNPASARTTSPDQIHGTVMHSDDYGYAEQAEMTATGAIVNHHAMVLRNENMGVGVGGSGAVGVGVTANGPETLQLAPLLHLQRSIATCFEEAHAQYSAMPEVSAQVRKGAVLCRTQLVESTKMLKKVEQTANEVLEMFPDLELAVEEEAPQLAADLFNLVKTWVAELRELVNNTQKINKASMLQIQKVVELSGRGLLASVNASKEVHHHHYHHRDAANGEASAGGGGSTGGVSVSKKLLEDVIQKLHLPVQSLPANLGGSGTGEQVNLDAQQVLELFMTLFSALPQNQAAPSAAQSHPSSSNAEVAALFSRPPVPTPTASMDAGAAPPATTLSGEEEGARISEDEAGMDVGEGGDGLIGGGQVVAVGEASPHSPASPRAAQRLAEALQKLRQVDVILEQLSIFWANTEVVLDLLTKKGQHVEQFINFASKPRLMARFRERMEEYKRFWEGIRMMCTKYVQGIKVAHDQQRMYAFLEGNARTDGDATRAGSESMEKNDSLDSFNNSFFGETSSPPNHHMHNYRG